MSKVVLTCNEMIEKFGDVYCKDRNVIIVSSHEFGTTMINTDRLQVYEQDGKITINDDNDTEMIINKSFISRISLSSIDECEELVLELGSSKIVFVII